MLAVVNTTATTLTAGATIPTGNAKARTNSDAVVSDGNIEIQKAGTFEVLGNFTFTATAAGAVTVQMQAGGTDVPGASATITATEGQTVPLTTQAVVQTRQSTPGAQVPITWTISAAGTLVSATASVKRVI